MFDRVAVGGYRYRIQSCAKSNQVDTNFLTAQPSPTPNH